MTIHLFRLGSEFEDAIETSALDRLPGTTFSFLDSRSLSGCLFINVAVSNC